MIDIAKIPGVAETLLADALVRQLPANQAEAPWECQCSAVVWLSRPTATASDVLARVMRRNTRALGVVGGMVEYRDTPVGAYNEVLACAGFRSGLRPAGSVVFMSVDSDVSLVGGRTNWGMPKTLATFDGAVGNRTTMTARAPDDAWAVAAKPTIVGPSIPLAAAFTAVQRCGDGQLRASTLRARGSFRPALVGVSVTSAAELSKVLRSGRHLGAVVDQMTFTLSEPGPA